MKTIAAFPDYTFHEDGRVYSAISGRFLKPIRMGEYLGLQLRDCQGVIRRQYLHRLIAEAFYGQCPEGQVCRHLDGDNRNNAASNLSWGTQSQNNLDKRAHGTSPDGERNPMARLTSDAVQRLRDDRDNTGASYAALAAKYGVSTMTAFRAATGRSWGFK